MIRIRRSAERGHANHGWLNSRHTFSFADYHDPAHMGFGPLRVINEDRVEPGQGFGRHAHKDMEILSYVLEGALEHKDSLGTGSIIRPGDLQRMTAGTGIQHSEFNPSPSDPVHFLQIWIMPEREDIPPGYEQKTFAFEATKDLVLVASRDGRNGALTVHQDADVYAGRLTGGDSVKHVLRAGRIGWVQVARGEVALNGSKLAAGDGAAIEGETGLLINPKTSAEILLFDMTP